MAYMWTTCTEGDNRWGSDQCKSQQRVTRAIGMLSHCVQNTGSVLEVVTAMLDHNCMQSIIGRPG